MRRLRCGRPVAAAPRLQVADKQTSFQLSSLCSSCGFAQFPAFPSAAPFRMMYDFSTGQVLAFAANASQCLRDIGCGCLGFAHARSRHGAAVHETFMRFLQSAGRLQMINSPALFAEWRGCVLYVPRPSRDRIISVVVLGAPAALRKNRLRLAPSPIRRVVFQAFIIRITTQLLRERKSAEMQVESGIGLAEWT